MRKIPIKNLKKIFEDHEQAADMLRYGMEHCERSLLLGEPAARFDVLGGHAVWFATTEHAVEWLYLLWDSSKNNETRFDLVNILRRSLMALPPWDHSEGNMGSDALRYTATSFLIFARNRRVNELLSTISQKTLGPGGWMYDADLRAQALMALYACNFSVEASQFFDRVVANKVVLSMLTLRQLQVFCAEYITSARGRLENVARGEREDELTLQLAALVAEVYPRQSAHNEGGAAFGEKIKAVFEEALLGIDLPPDLADELSELLNALQPQPDVKPISDLLKEINAKYIKQGAYKRSTLVPRDRVPTSLEDS